MSLHFVSSLRWRRLSRDEHGWRSLGAELERLGRRDARRRRRSPLAGEDRWDDIAIGDSGLQASAQACAAAATPSSGGAENLHELPIAVGVVVEASAIADSGVGRLVDRV